VKERRKGEKDIAFSSWAWKTLHPHSFT